MGDGGNQLVTGSLGESQSFNSPRSTMGVLITVTLVACALYWVAVANLFKGLYKNARIVSIPMKAGVQMAASLVVGNIEKVKNIADGTDSAVSKASNGRVRDAVGSATSYASDFTRRNLGGAGARFKKAFGRTRNSNRTQSSASKQANREVEKELEGVFDKPKKKETPKVEVNETQSKFDALDKEMKKDNKSDKT